MAESDSLSVQIPSDAGMKEAGLFLKYKAPNFHPAFGVTVLHDDQSDHLMAKLPRTASKPSQDIAVHKQSAKQDKAREQTKRLVEILEIYRKSHDDTSINGFNIRGKHTWDEVFREAKLAESQYKDTNRIRRIFRGIGDHAALIEPWIELIPDGDYTSVLRGGLKLVFKAAARRSDKRERILDALKELPQILTWTQDYEVLHFDDNVFNDLALEIYLIILSIVEGIIKWLTEKATWKRLRTTVIGSSDSPSLDESTRSLTIQQRRLRDRSDMLSKKRILNVDSGISQMQIDMASEFEKLQYAVKAQASLLSTLNDVVRENQWHHNRESFLERELEKKENENRRLQAAQEREQTNAVLTKAQLLDLLKISPDQIVWDAERVRERGHLFDSTAYSQAYWLFQHDRFQRLLQSPDPDILFIDAGTSQYTLGRLSPISHMCTLVAETLQSQPQAQVIQFYCGLHADWNDPDRGIDGLLRSLIAQLVLHFGLEQVSIGKRTYLNHLRDGDIKTLFQLFHLLVKRVPLNTVLFCIVDGISRFEVGERAHDAADLVRALRDMTQDEDIDAVLKVLLTSPTTSRLARHCVDPSNYLHLPPNIGQGRGTLTSRQIALMTRRARPQLDFVPGYVEGQVVNEGHSGAYPEAADSSGYARRNNEVLSYDPGSTTFYPQEPRQDLGSSCNQRT